MAVRIFMLLGVMLLASVAAGLQLESNHASANGGTRIIVDDVREGPYVYRVGISPGSPRMGNLHLSVLIQSADGDVSINDGQMTITATGPEAGVIAGPVQATNTLLNPQVFDANITITALGTWILSLATESEIGRATLEVPIQVTESGGFNLLTAVFIFVVAVLTVSLGLSYLQKRARVKRR